MEIEEPEEVIIVVPQETEVPQEMPATPSAPPVEVPVLPGVGDE